MPSSSATLRDFFTSHRDDRPKPQAAEGTVVALGDSVSVAVKDASVEPGALVEAVTSGLDGLLDIEVSTIIAGAWAKARLLQQYRDSTKYPPHEVIMVTMARHVIQSNHRPSLELLINDKRVDSLPIEIRFELTIEGLVLKVQHARIMEIRPGTCTGSGKITCKELVLAEEETRALTLPGVLSLGEGVEIPALGREAAKDADTAGRPDQAAPPH